MSVLIFDADIPENDDYIPVLQEQYRKIIEHYNKQPDVKKKIKDKEGDLHMLWQMAKSNGALSHYHVQACIRDVGILMDIVACMREYHSFLQELYTEVEQVDQVCTVCRTVKGKWEEVEQK